MINTGIPIIIVNNRVNLDKLYLQNKSSVVFVPGNGTGTERNEN